MGVQERVGPGPGRVRTSLPASPSPYRKSAPNPADSTARPKAPGSPSPAELPLTFEEETGHSSIRPPGLSPQPEAFIRAPTEPLSPSSAHLPGGREQDQGPPRGAEGHRQMQSQVEGGQRKPGSQS